MRKLILTIVAACSLAFATASVALAAPRSMTLPAAACNPGTMNAHESIPETTGTGATTPGHVAVPSSEEGPCSHGG